MDLKELQKWFEELPERLRNYWERFYAWLLRIYFEWEQKYYQGLDWLEEKGIPVYEYYVYPLEKNGIPSFPVTLALFLLILALLLWWLFASVFAPPVQAVVHVSSNTGEPVENALVYAYEGPLLRATGTTNTAGVTTLSDLPRKLLWFNATKPGFSPGTAKADLSKVTVVNITLQPTATPTPTEVPPGFTNECRVRVLSPEGAGLSATVKIKEADTHALLQALFVEKGEAVVQELPRGTRFYAVAQASGYLKADSAASPTTFDKPCALTTLTLNRDDLLVTPTPGASPIPGVKPVAARSTIRIRDQAGRPLAASVGLYSDTNAELDRNPEVSDWTVSVKRSVRYYTAAFRAGYLRGTAAFVGGEDVTLTLVLSTEENSASLRVRVLNGSATVSGAAVTVYATGEGVPPLASGTTGTDGTVTLQGFTRGAAVRARAYANGWTGSASTTLSQTLNQLDVQLGAPGACGNALGAACCTAGDPCTDDLQCHNGVCGLADICGSGQRACLDNACCSPSGACTGDQQACIQKPTLPCSDGTARGQCSNSSQYYCTLNGALETRASLCGCPTGYVQVGELCAAEPPPGATCADGTARSQCSSRKPWYCNLHALFAENATACGCPTSYTKQGETCVNPGATQCSDGSAQNACSTQKPFFCDGDGKLLLDPAVCGCPASYTGVNGQCLADQVNGSIACIDGTQPNQCSTQRPSLKCVNGALVERAGECGCPADTFQVGDRCAIDSRNNTLACADGTPAGQCATQKPFKCRGGQLEPAASTCGCPANYTKVGERCTKPGATQCQDGTAQNTCSVTKPYFCEGDGESVVRANLCNCPLNFTAVGYQCIQNTNQSCTDGTRPGLCSTFKPLFCSLAGALETRASLCGCTAPTIQQDDLCRVPDGSVCQDGTSLNTCSSEKPLYCNAAAALVRDPTRCGCPTGYERVGDQCILIITNSSCSDGTESGQCSAQKPFFCLNGALNAKASQCGCLANYTRNGEVCERAGSNTCTTQNSSEIASGTCSGLDSFYCNGNGQMIENATACGCPPGFFRVGNVCRPTATCDGITTYLDASDLLNPVCRLCTLQSNCACGSNGQVCCPAGNQRCRTDNTCDSNGFCRSVPATITPSVTPPPSPSVPPSCGVSGQACCTTGLACNAGLSCVNGQCTSIPCGREGQACCNPFSTPALTGCTDGLFCTAGTCTRTINNCGNLGQPGCAGDDPCRDDLQVVDGRCVLAEVCGPSGTACRGNTFCCADGGGTCKTASTCQSGHVILPNNQKCDLTTNYIDATDVNNVQCTACTVDSSCACGLAGQVCCPASGNNCKTGNRCQGGYCVSKAVSCGRLSESCCEGDTCEGTLVCDPASARCVGPEPVTPNATIWFDGTNLRASPNRFVLQADAVFAADAMPISFQNKSICAYTTQWEASGGVDRCFNTDLTTLERLIFAADGTFSGCPVKSEGNSLPSVDATLVVSGTCATGQFLRIPVRVNGVPATSWLLTPQHLRGPNAALLFYLVNLNQLLSTRTARTG